MTYGRAQMRHAEPSSDSLSHPMTDPTDKILSILAEVAETDEVRTDPELALYDLQVLDSMKTVQLIVALGEQLHVEISPAEFEREAWATPRKLVEDVLRRLAQ